MTCTRSPKPSRHGGTAALGRTQTFGHATQLDASRDILASVRSLNICGGRPTCSPPSRSCRPRTMHRFALGTSPLARSRRSMSVSTSMPTDRVPYWFVGGGMAATALAVLIGSVATRFDVMPASLLRHGTFGVLYNQLVGL
eukprot:5865627-Prymnesium_polylepis.1